MTGLLTSYHKIKTVRTIAAATARTDELNRARQLGLPGALLVTIHAQLLAPFVLIDFCLTAFFE
jgi:hypothetical protein